MSLFLDAWRGHFLAATDAPETYGHVAGIMALSTLALGKRRLLRGSGINPNVFLLITGESSVARKSTAIRFAKRAVAELAEHRIGPTDYTIEGLLKFMANTKDPNTGKGITRLGLFHEEYTVELQRSIGGYGENMKNEFCRIYDGDSVTKVRAKSDSLTVPKLNISLIGAVTFSGLSTYCSTADWMTGFFMRFLFVTPIEMRPTMRIPPPPQTAAWNAAIGGLALVNDALCAEQNQQGMSLTPAAEYAYDRILRQLEGGVVALDPDKKDPIFGPYLQRLAGNILKMAILYQIDEDPTSPVVDQLAIEQAAQFTFYCLWPSFQTAYEHSTIREFESALRVVRHGAAKPEGISKSEIYGKYSAQRGLPDSLISFVKRSGIFERFLNGDGEERWRLS